MTDITGQKDIIEMTTPQDEPEVTNKTLLQFMMNLKKDVEDVKAATDDVKAATENTNKVIEEKIADMDKKMEEMSTNMNERDRELKDRNDRMDNRLTRLEEEMKGSQFYRMKSNSLKAKEKSDMREWQNQLTSEQEGIVDLTSQSEGTSASSYKSDFAKTMEGIENQLEVTDNTDDCDREKEIVTNLRIEKKVKKSSVDKFLAEEKEKRKLIEAQNKEDKELREEKEKIKHEEKEKRKERTNGMRALRKWFGNDSTSDDTSGSDTSEDGTKENESWEKKIKRKEKNKERKRRSEKNKKDMKEKTAELAMHLLGVAPVEDATYTHYMNKGNTYDKAKALAASEYLQHYLGFTESEVERMDITDTLVSTKGDGTLYIAFPNLIDIKEIHYRVAEVKNPEINIRNYIPPQFYKRFMYLNRECQEYRKQNPNWKTQIRFNKKDLEILVKERGSQEPFRVIPINDLTDESKVPSFDYTIKWKLKTDRQPRRTFQPAAMGSRPPSLRDRESSLRRQRSTGEQSQGPTTKNRRTGDSDTEMEEFLTPAAEKRSLTSAH